MKVSWVAGSVRARAMARGRLGVAGARQLAISPFTDAIAQLASSTYGMRTAQVRPDVTALSRAVGETLLWDMRVLAGWLPAGGSRTLRVLCAGFEIANVESHLRSMGGAPVDPPYRLGRLATAWPALRQTNSAEELRAALARSPWRDPGGTSLREISLAMTLTWTDLVNTRLPQARPWAAALAALVVARERFSRDGTLPPAVATVARRVLGRAVEADTLTQLAQAAPPTARWVFAGVTDGRSLWQAEIRWWQRLLDDGAELIASAEFGTSTILGSAALLAADAWLVRAAVEASDRGGVGLDVLDALA